MEGIQKFLNENELIVKIIISFVIIFVSLILYKLIVNILEKSSNKSKILNNKKVKTYIKLTKSVLRYIFIIIALLMLLSLYGVDISSMLAGIGIVSVIVGLAIQDFLKDIIRGISILSDDYFSVGDVIKYKNIEGKILVIGLKTTKIQELLTGNIYSIPNRNIEDIAVLSNLIYVKVPLSYDLKLNEQHVVVNDIVNIIKGDHLIENCENVGLTELGESRIEYLLRITLNPVNKLQARRNVLEHIIEGLEKYNIKVPYNQLDVHQKS